MFRENHGRILELRTRKVIECSGIYELLWELKTVLRAVQMTEAWLAKLRREFESPLKTLSG